MIPQLRASGMDRLLSCPGSRTLLAICGAMLSDDGDEGTWLHYLIARRLIDELGAIPPEGGLQEPECPPPALGFSLWIVDWAFRLIKETVPDDWSILVECAIAYRFDGYEASGHFDLIALSPDATEALGFDWKTGRKPADPAKSNEQVATYIMLAKRAWPSLTKVTFRICQPLNDEDSGFEKVSEITLEGQTLDRLEAGMNLRVAEALAQPMQLCTGMQCERCVGVSCPAIQQEIKDMKLKMTEDMLKGITPEPDDKLLADVIVSAKTIEAPIKAAQELAKARIASQGHITSSEGTHIAVKETKGDYEITDPEAFDRELRSLVPLERMPYCTTPRITEIRKEIAAARAIPVTGKAAITGASVFDARLRMFTEQGTRKTLVFT